MPLTLEEAGFDNVPDPDAKQALEDALKASTIVGGRRRGGGPKEVAEAKAVSGKAVRIPSDLKKKVDDAIKDVKPTTVMGAVGTAARAVAPAAAVVASGAVAVNNPVLIANLAEVVAISLSEIAKLAATSTYSDWGQAIVSIGRGIGVIAETSALQAGQGPLIPFAIATAIMTWRAQSQERPKTLFQQITDDARAISSGVRRGATVATSAFVEAVRPDPMAALFEITEKARQIKAPVGAGADEVKALVKSELLGEPAMQSGLAGLPSVVPRGRPERDLRGAFGPITSSFAPPGVGDASRAAALRAADEARLRRAAGEGDGDAGMTTGVPTGKTTGKRGRDEGDEDGDEKLDEEEDRSKRRKAGRRSTVKKGKKVKRRTTRRKAPTSIKFAY